MTLVVVDNILCGNIGVFDKYTITQNVRLVNGGRIWVKVCSYKELSQAKLAIKDFSNWLGGNQDLCIIHETTKCEATE